MQRLMVRTDDLIEECLGGVQPQQRDWRARRMVNPAADRSYRNVAAGGNLFVAEAGYRLQEGALPDAGAAANPDVHRLAREPRRDRAISLDRLCDVRVYTIYMGNC